MFVVHTQTLENYGAHSEDGLYSSGNAYWKFKGGKEYVISFGVTKEIYEEDAYVSFLTPL